MLRLLGARLAPASEALLQQTIMPPASATFIHSEPFRTIAENQETGRTVTEVKRFETDTSVCDELFSLAGAAACSPE